MVLVFGPILTDEVVLMPGRAARPNPQIGMHFIQQLMGLGPEDRRRDSRGPNGLALRVIDDDAGFLALKEQWNTLQQAEAEELPERSFLWALHAWETIARPRGHKLHIIVGYSEGRIVLVMPLVVQRQWPIRIGRWLAPEFGECSDVLVKGCGRSDRWVASAWNLVASSFHLLRIPAVCLDASIWPHVEATRSLQKSCTRAPYVDCRQWPDWKSFLGSRSKAFVTDFKRSGKRLHKAGEARIIDIDQADQMRATLDWIVQEKTKRFAHTIYGAQILPSKIEFCRRICTDALASGTLLIRELWLGDERLAALWAIRSGRRLHNLTFAWNQNRKKYGAGRLIVTDSVRWAIEHKLRTYDLGLGKDEYKYRYTDKDETVATDVVVAFGPFDRFLSWAVVGARRLRRALHGRFRAKFSPKQTHTAAPRSALLRRLDAAERSQQRQVVDDLETAAD